MTSSRFYFSSTSHASHSLEQCLMKAHAMDNLAACFLQAQSCKQSGMQMLGAGKAGERPGGQVSCSWESSFVQAQLGSRNYKGFTPKGGGTAVLRWCWAPLGLTGHHPHLTRCGQPRQKKGFSAFRKKSTFEIMLD